MKTRLIWYDCRLNENKSSFWVECTDEEVKRCIMPFVTGNQSELELSILQNSGYSKINKNENEQIYCNFFLISYDYQCIKSYEWVVPYSGMWNAGNPFREIEVVDIQGLEELQGIYENLNVSKR